jgi:ribonuclease HI
VYGDEEKDLQGWVDADGASQDHRRAISGYVFMVDGGAVSWSSKKQELVTLSTTEAEYVAAMHAAKEAVWLRRLFGEIFPHSDINKPTYLHSESWTTNPPSRSQLEGNTMQGQNISMFGTILYAI